MLSSNHVQLSGKKRKKTILYEGDVQEKDVVLYFENSAIVQRWNLPEF